MAYATVSDVAVRIGMPEADLDVAQVQAMLDDVSALVDGYTGLDFASATDPLTGTPLPIPAGIKWVTISRTLRALNNPDGIRQEQIGTYSYSLADNTVGLGWTEEERRILGSFGNVHASRVAASLSTGYVEGA